MKNTILKTHSYIKKKNIKINAVAIIKNSNINIRKTISN